MTQGRNLDNNTGPSTGEPDSTPGADPELLSAPEQTLDNTATADGTYTPTSTGVDDDDIHLVEAEDLIIEKSMAGSLVQGTTVVTTLTVSVSEYRDFTDLVVRDLLPSPLCFSGDFTVDATSGGSDWQTNDCVGADTVQSTIDGSPVDVAQVRELPTLGPYGTGRFELVWDFADPENAALADLDADQELVITYSAVVREDYRGGLARLPGEPVLAGDVVSNEAEVSGPDTIGDASFTADPVDADGGIDGDTTSATLENGVASINKRVSVKAGPLADGSLATGATCLASYPLITWSEGDPAEPGYGPGDVVCFELGASFPPDTDYEGVVVQDLLPPGYEYIAGSAARIVPGDTLPDTVATGSDSLVSFALEDTGGDAGDVGADGHEFLWVIGATLVEPDTAVALDINENLQKLVHNNNGGLVFQLRDGAPAVWTEPQLRLAKGVSAVDSADNSIDQSGLGPDFDGSLTGGSTSVNVQADTTVTYRIDVWNTGNKDATNGEIQDVIPTGVDCTRVSSISNSGTCTAGRITWTSLPTVAASVGGGDVTPDDETSAPLTLTYDLDVPSDVTAAIILSNTAGVATYQGATNAATPFDYYPADNIDPLNTGLENTDAADDPAFISTDAPKLTKSQMSGITEDGNDANPSSDLTDDEATIGEIVEYTIVAQVPEGTTMFNAEVQDALPAGMVYFEGSADFDGSIQVLGPSATSTDSSGTGDDLDSGTFVTPAIGAAGTVRYVLPTPYDNEVGDVDDLVTLVFYAQVTDVPGNTGAPETRLRDQAVFDWEDAGAVNQPDIASNPVDTFVVEPDPTVVKDHTVPVGSDVLPGDDVTYRVTISNPSAAGRVSVAHDITAIDTVPIGVTPLQAGGIPVTADGQLVPTTGTPAASFDGTWSETSRTITWTPSDWAELESLDPDEPALVFTYDSRVDDPAVASATIINTVDITAFTLDQDTDPNAADARATTDMDTETLNLPFAGLTKDIEPFNLGDPSDDITTLTVGEPVDYQVTATVPADTIVYDATLFDDLPASLDFDSFGSISTSAGCEVFDAATVMTTGVMLDPGDIETFNPVGSDAGLAAWFIGDVFSDGGCTITVEYTAHVNTTANEPDSVTNDVLARLEHHRRGSRPDSTVLAARLRHPWLGELGRQRWSGERDVRDRRARNRYRQGRRDGGRGATVGPDV